MYNLLLVDDEPLIKVAFQSAVEWGKNGFLLAATASNGQEALHIVETQHIDAVITDLKMPGMDGLALIHELKKRSFIGPILVLSNYSDFDSVRSALTDGAYDYFLKINMNGESIGEHLEKMADLLRVQQQRQTEEDHRSFAIEAQKKENALIHCAQWVTSTAEPSPASNPFSMLPEPLSFPIRLFTVTLIPAKTHPMPALDAVTDLITEVFDEISGKVFLHTHEDEICGLIEQMKPDLVVIDSIQTMRCTDVASSSGTVSQVKESSARFLNVAKTNEIPTFIVGHVNKDGAIAGPKVMEHIVDTVLYFEGDKTLPYRVLRAVKNRYGSTNEIGMFDMTGKGLEQIENPSQVMLEGRPIGISGTCVACVMEGTRPVLSEIQALVTKTAFPSPRRTASGFDYNRMYLLLAVLEKRAGYVFGNQDVYINIIGGLKLDETACDLPVCLAMASSLLDLPVPEKTLAIGEVGLGGEVRSVPHLENRLREAQRVGFDTAIVPKHNLNMLDAAQFPGLRLVGVAYLREAINAIKINK